MEAVTDVDVTGAEAFASLKEWLRDQDVTLSFSRVRPGARERLTTFGILESETVYSTNRAAVDTLAPAPTWRDGLHARLFGHESDATAAP